MAERHSTDLVSLISGLLALTLAGLYLLDSTTAVELEASIFAAALVVVLGVGGLAASLRRTVRPQDNAPEELSAPN